MARFVKDTELNALLEKTIEEADRLLVLFCPYFKLHERIKHALKLRINDDKLRIIIVFGKNEFEPWKSLSREDYEFLKNFPQIDIAYEKRLHAKYYASERTGIITSLNLHEFSQNNNIEVGVQFESKGLVKKITDTALGKLVSYISDTEDLATEAEEFFVGVFENAQKIFCKVPKYKSAFFYLSKTYSHSEVVLDRSEWIFDQLSKQEFKPKNSIGFNAIKNVPVIPVGYCIRTGVEIPFDPSKPLSYDAYLSWVQFGNPEYPENYCHQTGRKSYGKTSMRNPIM